MSVRKVTFKRCRMVLNSLLNCFIFNSHSLGSLSTSLSIRERLDSETLSCSSLLRKSNFLIIGAGVVLDSLHTDAGSSFNIVWFCWTLSDTVRCWRRTRSLTGVASSSSCSVILDRPRCLSIWTIVWNLPLWLPLWWNDVVFGVIAHGGREDLVGTAVELLGSSVWALRRFTKVLKHNLLIGLLFLRPAATLPISRSLPRSNRQIYLSVRPRFSGHLEKKRDSLFGQHPS